LIDFGLDNIDFGLDTKPKEKKKFDPKDPYGMNNLASDLNQDITTTVNDIKQDIQGIKKDYIAIKNEAQNDVNLVKDYFKRKKAEKQFKNIKAFSDTVRAKRKLKEENPK